MDPAAPTEDSHHPPPPHGVDDPALSELLTQLQLSRYQQAFSREELTLHTAAKLNNDDLKEMGIPIGPRKALLEAFAKQQTSSSSLPAAPSGSASIVSQSQQQVLWATHM